jgi:hypothetical protein
VIYHFDIHRMGHGLTRCVRTWLPPTKMKQRLLRFWQKFDLEFTPNQLEDPVAD